MSDIQSPADLISAAKKIYQEHSEIGGVPTLFLLRKNPDEQGEIVIAPVQSDISEMSFYIGMGNQLNDGVTYRGHCILSKGWFSKDNPENPSDAADSQGILVSHAVVDDHGYYAIENEKNGDIIRHGFFDNPESSKPASPSPSPSP